MSHRLYTKLGESFDTLPGFLSDYRVDGAAYQSVRHYNIRSFHSDQITRTFTQQDFDFWENFGYQDMQVGDLRSITGQGLVNRDMTSLNTFTMQGLNGMTMAQLNYAATSTGNEEWTTGAGITLGRDAANRYMNRLSVALGAAELKTINSFYDDDILTGLEGDYNIELTLFDFLGTGLDLANSWLDFSTDVGFSPGNTASLQFSLASPSISGAGAGTETKAVWPRASLAAIDMTSIRGVRFRLKGGAAPFTFITNALRVLPNNGDAALPTNTVDTKRGIFVKAPMRSAALPTALDPDKYFAGTRPRNITVYARFNSGHNPVGSDNKLKLRARAEGTALDDYGITAELTARSTESRLTLTTFTGGTVTVASPAATNILTESTDYFMVLTVNDAAVKAAIHSANGILIGSEIYSVTQTTTRLVRGYVGYNMTAYNTDFTLDYVQAQNATFAAFVSTSFNSDSWVQGASLFVDQSPPAALLEDGGEPIAWGDGTLTRLASYDTVTRTGLLFHGGITYEQPVMMGTGRHVYIRGKVWPESSVNGTYRIALLDEYDSVNFVAELSDLLPNRWNDFEITFPNEIFTVPLFLHIQQQGYHSGTFRLSEVRIDHNVISWEATSDNAYWQSFLDTLNEPYGAIHFNNPGKQLKLRATAYSDQAWISNYQLVPHYGRPGSPGTGLLFDDGTYDDALRTWG